MTAARIASTRSALRAAMVEIQASNPGLIVRSGAVFSSRLWAVAERIGPGAAVVLVVARDGSVEGRDDLVATVQRHLNNLERKPS